MGLPSDSCFLPPINIRRPARRIDSHVLGRRVKNRPKNALLHQVGTEYISSHCKSARVAPEPCVSRGCRGCREAAKDDGDTNHRVQVVPEARTDRYTNSRPLARLKQPFPPL